MLLAHPPEELTGLGLLPVGLSLLGGLAVVGLGGLLPGRRAETLQERAVEVSHRREPKPVPLPRIWRSGSPLESWVGGLSRAQVATRAFAVLVLFFAIAAARVGQDFQLENIAPSLVLGVGWPLLLLGSAVLGPIWRWLDPWDGVARLVESEKSEPEPRDEVARAAENVWPALLPAFAWAWYLNAYSGTVDPRPLGAALAAYSLFMVAACVAFGRQLWLSRTEIFGLLFSWTARLPRGQLVSWVPPAGAEAVIGVLAGGFIFGRVRMTAWWGTVVGSLDRLTLYSAMGVLVCAALGGALLWFLARRSAQLGAPGAVAAASVPALVSIALAVSMASNRLSNSVQLLPRLIGDPFGFGWDPFGTADWLIRAEPFGHVGLKVIQMIVLLIGHVVGAIVLSRRVPQSARPPALAALALLFVPTLIAVAGTA